MNHQQEDLKAKLIDAGLWDASAKWDPTKNWTGLEELSEKLQRSLADSACLFVFPLNDSRQSYQVVLSYKEDEDLVIGLGKDICEAICRAALKLSVLFAERPEYKAEYGC